MTTSKSGLLDTNTNKVCKQAAGSGGGKGARKRGSTSASKAAGTCVIETHVPVCLDTHRYAPFQRDSQKYSFDEDKGMFLRTVADDLAARWLVMPLHCAGCTRNCCIHSHVKYAI
jgi:hypothetical protein